MAQPVSRSRGSKSYVIGGGSVRQTRRKHYGESAIIRCDGAVAAADFINLVRGMGFEAKLYRGVW